MKKFEELLGAYQHECIEYGVRGGVTGLGRTTPLLAARHALVEYVRERMRPDAYTDDLCPTHGTNYNKACHACVSLLMREGKK